MDPTSGFELYFEGTHFKASIQGHKRPVYAKEYFDIKGHPRQSQRAWRQLPSLSPSNPGEGGIQLLFWYLCATGWAIQRDL